MARRGDGLGIPFPERFADDVNRSAFRLHIDPAKILAENSDTDQIDSPYEKNGDEQGGVTGNLSPRNEGSQDDEGPVAECSQRDAQAEIGPDA